MSSIRKQYGKFEPPFLSVDLYVLPLPMMPLCDLGYAS